MHCTALAAWAAALSEDTEPLLGKAQLSRYIELARDLNLDGGSYYAECRLQRNSRADDATRRALDLLIAFDRRDANAALCERMVRAGELANAAARPVWDCALGFVKRWTAPDDDVRRLVSTIWLEFDDVERSTVSASPSLSACIVQNYDRSYQAPEQPTHAEDAESLITVYRALAGRDATDDSMVERLRACTLALPRFGKFIHLSLMSARHPASVKLYGVVQREDLCPYLRRIGWQGATERLEEALQKLATERLCGPTLFFDLNLTNMLDTHTATFGIAFAQQQISASIDSDVRRRALLDCLVAGGQCGSVQADLLATWAGNAGFDNGTRRGGRVKRWLDIKTVLSSTGELESKAYLGFRVNNHPFVIGA